MARMTEQQIANSLITLFIETSENKIGRRPIVNRYSLKWGFLDMLSDLGLENAKRVIVYFFDTTRDTYDPKSLLGSYDELFKAYMEREQDRATRAELRMRTKKKVEADEQH